MFALVARVGSALLEHAIGALRNEGMRKVYLMVLKDNDIGNDFWEKRGFSVPDGTLYRAKEIVAVVPARQE